MTDILDRPPVDHATPLASPESGSPGGDERRRFWQLAGAASLLFLFLILAMLFAVAIASDGDGDATSSGDGGAVASSPIAVELGDMFIKPSSITVAAGEDVVLEATNAGAVPHNVALEGTEPPLLAPGEHATVNLGPIEASTTAFCTVPGHKEAGMVMEIEVAGTDKAPTGATAAAAKIDPNATPEATWTPFDPALRPAAGGAIHDVTFKAVESVVEVAPGVTQELWTFNGQMPGPVLRVKLGDVVSLTLVNDGKLGHSIDFHASEVAWNDEMRTIQPGESLVYQFKAEHAGIFMYHCGTAPALHHIGNGMYGTIIVDPPDLTPVDREFVFVQGELYLGPEGKPGDLTKMTGEQHDAVVFNGYHNQYLHKPIRVEPGETLRVWVLDAGPSENSSFHIVGTVFDRVYKEGAYVLRGGVGAGGAQALDLQPAQGGFVEFTFDEAGLYPIVTHKFANVGKGALGLFQAGEVEASGGGH